MFGDNLETLPVEIARKYPRTGHLTFPDGEVETIRISKKFFVPDHNSEREYWKGFEIIEWSSEHRELRVCYWTRERGTNNWIWGQYSPIISLDKLKALINMVEPEI